MGRPQYFFIGGVLGSQCCKLVTLEPKLTLPAGLNGHVLPAEVPTRRGAAAPSSFFVSLALLFN